MVKRNMAECGALLECNLNFYNSSSQLYPHMRKNTSISTLPVSNIPTRTSPGYNGNGS